MDPWPTLGPLIGCHYDVSNKGNSDDLESPSRLFPYCKSIKCDFSYSCAAVDKVSTDIARNFLSEQSSALFYVTLRISQ